MVCGWIHPPWSSICLGWPSGVQGQLLTIIVINIYMKNWKGWNCTNLPSYDILFLTSRYSMDPLLIYHILWNLCDIFQELTFYKRLVTFCIHMSKSWSQAEDYTRVIGITGKLPSIALDKKNVWVSGWYFPPDGYNQLYNKWTASSLLLIRQCDSSHDY